LIRRHPVELTSPLGKEQYSYDDKGNIVETIVRGDDGSILGREKYEYDFDELGNWKKMTTSIAVYEDGKLSFEPIEVTYRTIAYYYNKAVEGMATASRCFEFSQAAPVDQRPLTNVSAQPRLRMRRSGFKTSHPKNYPRIQLDLKVIKVKQARDYYDTCSSHKSSLKATETANALHEATTGPA